MRTRRPAPPESAIVVVGSSNTDLIVRLKRIPRPGETLLGGKFLSAAGGKGANQAVAAARLGARVSLIGRVGNDDLGDQAIARLESEGIGVAHLARDRTCASGVALIFVGEDGANSIAVAPGANARLSVTDIRKARPLITGAGFLVMQLEVPLKTVCAAAAMAAANGVPVILNPAPAQTLPASLLRHVSILTPNESETELLTGIRLNSHAAITKAAARLRERGVETVVITLGARGALIANAQGARRIPGYRVKAVDTTAAGDVFNGALAVALGEGQMIDAAVRYANAAAAVSVTRMGAQPSAPGRRAVERLLRSR
jgi:ribokinase